MINLSKNWTVVLKQSGNTNRRWTPVVTFALCQTPLLLRELTKLPNWQTIGNIQKEWSKGVPYDIWQWQGKNQEVGNHTLNQPLPKPYRDWFLFG